ncbi:MAG: 3-hydroxyacyl-CoA dehydrogenase family protein [Bacteroidetes bacterium]|nr:3-hydroxyacyl-CoA dehydrogenase family protein [Bacteroidota bacterium]
MNTDKLIKTVAVIGIGHKGTVLIRLIATKGFDVVIYDVNETLLRRSIELIKNDLRKAVQQRIFSHEEITKTLERIKTKTHLPDTGNCDIIIETVPDDIKIKKDILKHLDINAKNSSLLVTTTSLYTVSSVASYAKNTERIVGLRFPHSIDNARCVEVTPTLQTKEVMVAKAFTFVQSLGKIPILTNDSPTSIAESANLAWYREALYIAEEGVATFEQIDRLVTMNLAIPQGPFQQMDIRGLDQIHHALTTHYQQRFYNPRFVPSSLLQQMVDLGLHGTKTGRGFFTYPREAR